MLPRKFRLQFSRISRSDMRRRKCLRFYRLLESAHYTLEILDQIALRTGPTNTCNLLSRALPRHSTPRTPRWDCGTSLFHAVEILGYQEPWSARPFQGEGEVNYYTCSSLPTPVISRELSRSPRLSQTENLGRVTIRLPAFHCPLTIQSIHW
jgi:hypothetical protein